MYCTVVRITSFFFFIHLVTLVVVVHDTQVLPFHEKACKSSLERQTPDFSKVESGMLGTILVVPSGIGVDFIRSSACGSSFELGKCCISGSYRVEPSDPDMSAVHFRPYLYSFIDNLRSFSSVAD